MNHPTTMEYTTLFHGAHQLCDRFMQREDIRAFQAFYDNVCLKLC